MTTDPPVPGPESRSDPAGETVRLAAPASLYWIGTAVTLAGSLARGKMFAVALGPRGVGLVAQLANFAIVLSGLGALGLGNAGVKLLATARARGDDDEAQRIISTLVIVPATLGLVLLGLVLGLRTFLSETLLGSPRYGWYVVGALCSVPLNLVFGSCQVILQAYGRVARLAVNAVAAAIGGTAIVACLVIPFGVAGGVASIVATSAVGLTVVLTRERWIVRKVLPARLPVKATRRQVVAISGASLMASIVSTGVDTTLRSVLVHLDGLRVNGIFQPVYILSSQVFVQFTSGLVLVLLPALSTQFEQGRHDDARDVLARAVRFITFVEVAVVLAVMAGRAPALTTFFNKDFAPAAPVLALQLLGELPRGVAYALSSILLPARMVRSWLAVGLAASMLQLVLGLALVPALGLDGLAIAYVVSWVVAAVLVAVLLRRTVPLGVVLRDWRLVAAGVGLTGAAAALLRIHPALTSDLIVGGLAVGWLVVVPRADERRRAVALVARARATLGRRPHP